MKAFISACVVALVIAVVGVFVLDGIQKPADVAFTASSARI